jgi:hypothetical protein
MNIGFSIIVATSVIVTNIFIHDKQVRLMQMLWRACIVCNTAVIIRIASFLMTILPAPAPQCSKDKFTPPQSVYDILFDFDTGNGCSDLMFSSHMLYGLVAVCALTHYMIVGNRSHLNAPNWLRIARVGFIALAWVTALTEAITIVAQQRHYSIDVFTAMYVVPLVWIAYVFFIPSDPVAKLDEESKSTTDESV